MPYPLAPAQRSIYQSIINRILRAPRDVFIIFYVDTCPYCRNALNFLRQRNYSYKAYDIDRIDGGMYTLLNALNQDAYLVDFDTRHRTKPLIFLNGRFVGGYNELTRYY